MKSRSNVLTVLVVNVLIQLSSSYSTYLDSNDNILFEWQYDETYITFNITAKTTGWFGIGFSQNGGMPGSDIITAWVKDGRIIFQDRYADAFSLPQLDVSQDYTLLDGYERDGITFISAKRKLDTCDSRDYRITDDTVRVIWAMSRDGTDPVGDNPSYHGYTNRGAKSLLLTRTVQTPPKTTDPFTYDIQVDNFIIPTRDTYYHCELFKPPQLDTKHHLVKYEPIIRTENLGVVHHMILYGCYHNDDMQYHFDNKNTRHQCYHRNMPNDMKNCYSPVATWAIGGDAVYYPEEAGFPLGKGISPDYYMLEIHYDNPQLAAGIIDDAGLRLTITPDLRKYDAGVLQIGDIDGIAVPPKQKEFKTTGFCQPLCTKKTFPADGITVFGTTLHGHLAARKIVTRHFRKDQELPVIDSDMNYDFNYQEYKFLRNPVKIYPGDTLMTTCHYDTSKRDGWTWGGLSSRSEMCLTFMFYYPSTELARCESRSAMMAAPSYPLKDIFNITAKNITPYNVRQYISKPGFWDDDKTAKLEYSYTGYASFPVCVSKTKGIVISTSADTVYRPPAVVRAPFKKSESTCPK